MKKTYIRVLTIAGSDSGGGAGIQADLKTFAAFGCYGMSVITAVTAQNTRAMTGIYPMSAECIARQLDAVLEDIGADAVKIGMVHSAEAIHAIADRLTHYRAANVIVDPVMIAKSGDSLLQEEAISALKRLLFPIAALITPNIPEAAILLGISEDALQEQPFSALEAVCQRLAEFGPQAVLLKGGHLKTAKSIDILHVNGEQSAQYFEADRIDTENTHGTGCALSSAIAAGLARGEALPAAVSAAKAYLTQAIKSGAAYQFGHGHGPAHHFHRFWE